jgi:hypothetical protein
MLKRASRKSELVMVRFSEGQYAKVVRAAEQLDVPVAVMCRTLVLVALEEGRQRPLRGNLADYVDGAALRGVLTCETHPGEPLYVTQQGSQCAVCLREQPSPVRETGT